jgi:hypothetical protein
LQARLIANNTIIKKPSFVQAEFFTFMAAITFVGSG